MRCKRKDLLTVELENTTAVVPDHRGQGCGGIDLGRGADYQQQVTVGDEVVDGLDTAH